MTPEDAAMLAREHVEILGELTRLWTAFILILFLGLLFMLVTAFLAIWSVRSVNQRQAAVLQILVANARAHVVEHAEREKAMSP